MKNSNLIFILLIWSFLKIEVVGQAIPLESSFSQINISSSETDWGVPFQFYIPKNSISVNINSNLNNVDNITFLNKYYRGRLDMFGSEYEIKVWSNSFTEASDSDEKNEQLSKIVKSISINPNYKNISEIYRKIQNEERSSLSRLYLRLTYEKVIDLKIYYVEAEFRGILDSTGGAIMQFEVVYTNQFNRELYENEFTRVSNVVLDNLQVVPAKSQRLEEDMIGVVNQEGTRNFPVVPPPGYDDKMANKKNISKSNSEGLDEEEPMLYCSPPMYFPLIYYVIPAYTGGSMSEYESRIGQLKSKNEEIKTINEMRLKEHQENIIKYRECLNDWLNKHSKWRNATPNWKQKSVYTSLFQF